jgi:outer membrane PBP1 activator LpoA protein
MSNTRSDTVAAMILTTRFALHLPSSLGLLAILLGIAACAPPQPVVKPPPPPDPAAAAETYLAAGDYPGAAAEYERLAASTGGAAAERYLMNAALAYQDADDFATANALLATPPVSDPKAADLQALANARMLLRERMPEQALEQLRTLSASQLTPYQESIRHRTEGRAEWQLGNYSGAVDALLAADKSALPADQRAALQEDIWNAVSHLPDYDLAALGGSEDPVKAGWGTLGLTVRAHLDDTALFPERIEHWKQQFPVHRAQGPLIERLLELSENFSVRPRRVALLLPFDTRFSGAAKAIRDGFLTAWYSDPQIGMRPAVAIYDAEDSNINEAYERAVVEGAELIVGPLGKNAVGTLAARTDLTVPVLALNEAGDGSAAIGDSTSMLSAGFYQFGLVPEDEVRQTAARAWSDGHTRAIALVPDSSWGERLLAAFAEQWRKLGGTLLGQIAYTNDPSAYAMSVKQALNIDLSEARAAALRKFLRRPIVFEPRRRADVDFVFLAAFPVNARQLLPQLRYYRAEAVPVYATSHVFTGVIDTGRDQDLDGVIFGDMPWLVGAADVDSFNAVSQGWAESTQVRRLFAFGIDAYRIIPYLARMRVQHRTRVPGATGLLHMDAAGRIHRELTWLRFADGAPVATHGLGRPLE